MTSVAAQSVVEPSRAAVRLPRRLLLQWHVTERCNGRCTHCYQEQSPGEELALSRLFDILEQFSCFLDACDRDHSPEGATGHVTITGGEPFVREDILDLLDELARHRDRFTFALLTNGTLIDDRLARYLSVQRPLFVQVSMEGTPATHDRMRGAGSFELVARAVRRLVRQGVPTFISFTAHRGNFREFPEVARIGRRLGSTAVWTDRLIPLGHADSMQDLLLSPDETREYVSLIAQAARRHWWKLWRPSRVADHRALQFLGRGRKAYRCAAGRTLLTLMPNGDLLPCRRMPIRVGNVLETPLIDLYRHSEALRALRRRERVAAGCEGCEHARTCGGGLRCLAHAVHGDAFRADPGCWLATGQTISCLTGSKVKSLPSR